MLRREPGDHSRLGRAGDGADDDRVEEDTELALLGGDLIGPARETETTERMVGASRRDCVRPAASLGDGRERFLEARPEADIETGCDEPHVRAHDPREEDVPDTVVDDVRPVDPVLADDDAAEPESSGGGRNLAGVVRLDAADRDERVAALRECVGGEVLELPHLVAPVRQS